jgi:hypothetical protein
MPVAAERRFFVAGGRVVCHHPYWPEGVFEDDGAGEASTHPQWRSLLAETNAVTESELPLLMPMVERVAQVFHNWSVDFARGKDGTWYAIDMALARMSWHWPGCPEAHHE